MLFSQLFKTVVQLTHNSQPVSEDALFDTLMRRQLRGAKAQVCDGFDTDAASAYLERTLLPAAQEAFETHLADCTGCRQHVTALMMLNAQFAPSSVEALLLMPSQASTLSWWSHLTERVNEWRASFELNWGLAGAGLTVAALLVTFSVYQWQRQGQVPISSVNLALKPESSLTAVSSDEFRASAADTSQISNLPAVLAETAGAPLLQAETKASLPQAPGGALAKMGNGTAPTPPVLPNLGAARPQVTAVEYLADAPAPLRGLEIPGDVVALNGASVTRPVVPLATAREFFGGNFPNANGMQGTPVSLAHNGGYNSNGLSGRLPSALESAPTVNSLNVVKDQLERQSRVNDLVAVDNAKLNARADAESNAKNGKHETSRTRAIVNALTGQRSAMGFVAGKGAEARTKEADKTTNEPLANPLTKRVNGHTFYFERGIWIDENYRNDLTLPLIKVTRGNERYQTLVIENPTLEEFFQLGQVIVVWKGKIYELRKKDF